MDDFCQYAVHPLAFIWRYVRLRPGSHLLILTAVVAAVACSVGTQYGLKFLVDALSANEVSPQVWAAFALLVLLIASDNLLWRLASWVGHAQQADTYRLQCRLFDRIIFQRGTAD